VVQEALHNCVRHSGAKTVRITVKQRAEDIYVLIQDDGRGFRPGVEKGLGLIGMQERVTHLGGTFRIDSAVERGTLLAITLPFEKPLSPTPPASYEYIRILLADDHVVMRRGIRALLERREDFQVVAEAGDGREAVRLTRDPFAACGGRRHRHAEPERDRSRSPDYSEGAADGYCDLEHALR